MPNAQLLLALAYLNLKDKPKAEAVFRQMLQDYGDRAIWHVIIGGAYRETGYQFEAVEEFRKASRWTQRCRMRTTFLA